MGLGIPPLLSNIMLESNPPKPTMLVGRLAVCCELSCLFWFEADVEVRSRLQALSVDCFVAEIDIRDVLQLRVNNYTL